MATKPLMALALVDMPNLGAQAGDLIQGDPALVDSLAAIGQADAHKDAVAYGKKEGRAVVVVSAPPAEAPAEQ